MQRRVRESPACGVNAAGKPAEGKCLLLIVGVLPRALTAEPEALP